MLTPYCRPASGQTAGLSRAGPRHEPYLLFLDSSLSFSLFSLPSFYFEVISDIRKYTKELFPWFPNCYYVITLAFCFSHSHHQTSVSSLEAGVLCSHGMLLHQPSPPTARSLSLGLLSQPFPHPSRALGMHLAAAIPLGVVEMCKAVPYYI